MKLHIRNEEEWKAIITGKVNSASLREVLESCRPGEMPEFILGDGANGVLAAFSDRCIIIKKGLGTSFMAGSFGGGRTATFAYRDITGIEYNSGMLAGVLEILTASYSGKATNSPWAFGSDRSAHESSNTLPWDKSFYNRVRPKIEWLKQQIQDSKYSQTVTSSSSDSIADEIAKLSELRKQGILSGDEFEAAKKRLINR